MELDCESQFYWVNCVQARKVDVNSKNQISVYNVKINSALIHQSRLSLTESKLILLAPCLANKSRDKLLGQGIATLFRKPADQEDGGLASQRTILPELEFRLPLY